MLQQTVADSLDTVLRLMQDHIRGENAARAALVGQTKYDSTVIITLITSIAGVMTAAISVVGVYFKNKLDALRVETNAQTSTMDSINVKVNGQLERALARVDAVQAELTALKVHGTDAAIREIADLHTKLDVAVAELAAIRAKVAG